MKGRVFDKSRWLWFELVRGFALTTLKLVSLVKHLPRMTWDRGEAVMITLTFVLREALMEKKR